MKFWNFFKGACFRILNFEKKNSKILHSEKFENFKVLAFPLYILKKFRNLYFLVFHFFLYIKKRLFMSLLSAFTYTFKNSKTFIIFKILFIKPNISDSSGQLSKWFKILFFYSDGFSRVLSSFLSLYLTYFLFLMSA